MSAVPLMSVRSGGFGPGEGTTYYMPPGQNTLPSIPAEANAQVTYRTAGTLSGLRVYKTQGDRTGMTARVRVDGVNGNGNVAFTSTNGTYEDTTNSDVITPGQAVCWRIEGGTGGTVALSLRRIAVQWAATDTTQMRMIATGIISLSNTVTYYVQPAGQLALNVVQAQGEWLVKLPAGASALTIKNLFVRASTNTATGGTTVISINGATGAGTAPTLTIPTNAGAATYEDTTNSILVNDGDLISIKIICSKTAGSLSILNVAIEVDSPDGVFHLLAGIATGAAIGASVYLPLAGGMATNAAESNTYEKLGVVATVSKFSAYVTVEAVSTALTLRSDSADAGTPSAMNVNITATGWVTDSANTYTPAATNRLAIRTTNGGATLTCIALTCQSPGAKSGSFALSHSHAVSASEAKGGRGLFALAHSHAVAASAQKGGRGTWALANSHALAFGGSAIVFGTGSVTLVGAERGSVVLS